MERKKPPMPQMYNYSFLILTLLPLLCGPLHKHVNIINAVAGCRDFSNDKHRYFKLSDSSYKSYLSKMKAEEQNPLISMQQLFAQGVFEGIQHKIPDVETFSDITYGILTFKYKSYELDFRDTVRNILLNGQNNHMSKSEIDNLLYSASNDDITTFIFKCFYVAIMCGGNTSQYKPRKSDVKKAQQDTIREVDQMTAAEKEELRIPDDTTNN